MGRSLNGFPGSDSRAMGQRITIIPYLSTTIPPPSLLSHLSLIPCIGLFFCAVSSRSGGAFCTRAASSSGYTLSNSSTLTFLIFSHCLLFEVFYRSTYLFRVATFIWHFIETVEVFPCSGSAGGQEFLTCAKSCLILQILIDAVILATSPYRRTIQWA